MSASSSGNGSANYVQRSMLPQSPYATLQQQQQQLRQHQQQQLQYMQTTASNHPMGINMTMGMRVPTGQSRPSPLLPTESSVTPYWRPMMIEPQHATYNHLNKGDPPNTMDLEYSEFLNPARESNNTNTHNLPTGDDSPFAMREVTTSATSSCVTPLYSKPSNGSSRTTTTNNSDGNLYASRMNNYHTRGTTTVAASDSDASVRPAMPTQVAGSTDKPQEKDDRCEEPDLTQRKIEVKNEKCHYHKCPNRARVSQLYGHFCNRHVIVAPCGFPGCRDKAMVQASMCDKHLNEGKDALHRILATRAQNVPVCRTFGCFKNDQGRGYCRGHEKLLMAIGRLPKHINKRRLNSAYTMCSYPNCNKHSQRHHLCRTHGNMLLKQAQELAKEAADAGTNERVEDILARLQKDIRACSHPTCTKNSQRDRLCTTHYYEKMNRQRMGGVAATESTSGSSRDTSNHQVDGISESEEERESDTTVQCNVNGCNNSAFSKGLCKVHGHLSVSQSQKLSHARCSIQGCGQMMLNKSGLCGYHSSEANQTLSITRMGQAESSNNASHLHHRRMFGGQTMELAPSRPTLKPTNMSTATFFTQTDGPHGMQYALHPSSGVTGRETTRCSNPMCTREVYDRDFCDACQNMFSPLVVSVGDVNKTNTSTPSYPYEMSSGDDSGSSRPTNQLIQQGWGTTSIQSKEVTEQCRTKNCTMPIVRGGLCEEHFRSFSEGSLSVDEIRLHSCQPSPMLITNGKQPSNTQTKKYFCKVDSCDKQVQKRGFCKRHFRMQDVEDNQLEDEQERNELS